MLFKIKEKLTYFSFLVSLTLLSYFITDLLIEFSKSNTFNFDRLTLLINILLLIYCIFYIIRFSNAKFKDFALLLIFIGLGGSSRVFYIYFIHVFHKIFFLGVILLIFYILYEVKQDYNSIVEKIRNKIPKNHS